MVRRVGFGSNAAAVERPQKAPAAAAATPERASAAPSLRLDRRARQEGRPAPARFALAMALAAVVVAWVVTRAEGGLDAVGRGLTQALAGERPLADVLTPYVPALLLLAVGAVVGLFGGRRRARAQGSPAAMPVATAPTETTPRRRSGLGRAITGLVLVVWLGLWAAGLVAAYGIFREAQAEPGHGAQFLGFWLVVAALGWLALLRALLRVLIGR